MSEIGNTDPRYTPPTVEVFAKWIDCGPEWSQADREAMIERFIAQREARAATAARRSELEAVETLIKGEVGKTWILPKDTVGMAPAQIVKRSADWLLNHLRADIQDRLAGVEDE